jgi:ribosomal protein S13
MTDNARVKKLSTAQLKKLNNAYEAFNKTADQRRAVVKNVQQECDIKLT